MRLIVELLNLWVFVAIIGAPIKEIGFLEMPVVFETNPPDPVFVRRQYFISIWMLDCIPANRLPGPAVSA
jgi:hypothetical protein